MTPTARTQTYTLPFPPSVNTYWRRNGHTYFIAKKGKEFRDTVCKTVGQVEPLTRKLRLSAWLHPPNRIRRDIDNYAKSLLDSLQHAGVYGDDSQIDELHVYRGEITEGGEVVVHIEEL